MSGEKPEAAGDNGTEEAAGASQGKAGGKRGLLRSVFAVLIVYGLSAGVSFFVLPPPDPDPHAGAHEDEHAEEDKEPTRVTYEIPTVLVNLAGSGGKRYLKAGIVIDYTTKKPDEAAKRIEEKAAALRDALITLLSSKDQRAVDGREKIALLKLEIAEELNKVLFPDDLGEVETVYFQEFIVQ